MAAVGDVAEEEEVLGVLSHGSRELEVRSWMLPRARAPARSGHGGRGDGGGVEPYLGGG